MPRIRLHTPLILLATLVSFFCQSAFAAQWGPVEVAGQKDLARRDPAFSLRRRDQL